jgi:hypothetical protein
VAALLHVEDALPHVVDARLHVVDALLHVVDALLHLEAARVWKAPDAHPSSPDLSTPVGNPAPALRPGFPQLPQPRRRGEERDRSTEKTLNPVSTRPGEIQGISVVDQGSSHSVKGTAKPAQAAEDKGFAAPRLLSIRKASRS